MKVSKMSVTNNYSLEDINKIKLNGFSFELPKKTYDLIVKLSKLVGSPDYIKTPVFQKKRRNEEPDWDLLKQFKPTEKVERTSNEQLIQNIKGSLNKMTDKNYEKMSCQIMENLTKLEDTDLFVKVNDIIFNIVSSNRFYSKIYASFYKELIDKSNNKEVYTQRLKEELTNYMNRYLLIKSHNPNEDYEAFCDANKENERRKAMTLFFVNLMIMKVVCIDEIVDMYNRLCDLTLDKKFDSSHKQTIVEISENLYIIVESGKSFLKEEGVLDNMIEQASAISKLQVKQHPGLSNKAVFKFMDITDIKI